MGVDPDEVTRALGLFPTETRKAGAERAPGKVWHHHDWSIRSGVSETEIDAAKHFEDLFAILQPHIADINAFTKRWHVTPSISWVVYVFADEQAPNGVIPPQTFRILCELDAWLNVSLYFDRQALG